VLAKELVAIQEPEAHRGPTVFGTPERHRRTLQHPWLWGHRGV